MAGGKTLEFGGKGLPEGTHTYLIQTKDGKRSLVDHVTAGQKFPADQVEDAQGYVKRGQAKLV